MSTFPSLKKCFDFVSDLSKKILGTNPVQSLALPDQVPTKSQQSHPNFIQIDKKLYYTKKKENKLNQLLNKQKPRVISFDAYINSKADSLKSPCIKNATNNQNTYNNKPKTIYQHLMDDETAKIRLLNLQKNTNPKNKIKQNISPKKLSIKQFQDDQNLDKISQSSEHIKQKPDIRPYQNVQQQNNKLINNIPRKKDKKKAKKSWKKRRNLIGEQLNSIFNPFTYEDGDDISSISQRSETTDEIQPELWVFLHRKNSKNLIISQTNKKQTQIIPNMKKKGHHQQGQTVEKMQDNSDKMQQIAEILQSLSQQQKQLGQRRLGFFLYPGETIQQFKKRVLIGYGSHQDEDSDQLSPFKRRKKQIKRQQYERILKQLNSSIMSMKKSEMQQQRVGDENICLNISNRNDKSNVNNRRLGERSKIEQKVIEKMIDQSENENQQSQKPKRKTPPSYYSQIENYTLQHNRIKYQQPFYYLYQP